MPVANHIELDDRLAGDSHILGDLDGSLLLLMRNALFPWLVLVPDTQEVEFYRLEPVQQSRLLEQINLVSRFIDETFQTDKINVATIGNVVSQLHVHVVGRRRDDACWPGVVWGVQESKTYRDSEVQDIKHRLTVFVPDTFTAHNNGS